MTRIHRVLTLLVLVGVTCAPSIAWAQFETPNRQFHDKTLFRLEGRHLEATCESCHLEGVFKGTPTTCKDCHWVRRQDDRFRLQLGSDCAQCHNPTSWTSVRFDHGVATGLVLSGEHRQLGCQSCHKNNDLRSAQSTCITCHQQDFQSAREPDHVAAGFPTTCDACHSAADASFSLARFDHQASFPLVGTHATQTCASCHTNNVFQGTPRDCVGCHRTQYDRTTAPSHAAAGFPTSCESCHRATDSAFLGVTFDHAAVFPLQGQHAQQVCASCHVNNVYQGTPRDCVGCHRQEYERTTGPAHAPAGFSTNCESCHRATDSSFRGVTFDHGSFFPLVGQHVQQTCATCHVNNVFKGTARDCVGCHRSDYDRTTTPVHSTAGFSTDCESCHRASDSSFRGATFNHAAIFALEGQHAQQTCTACHVNNVYQGTPRDCVGCHRTQWERTTAPSHQAAGFGMDCVSCHRATDNAWTQGVFNHRFPIASGRHKAPCATCHTNSGSYQEFTCLTCHEHSQSEMDKEHRNRNGYRYESMACYGCHPNGRE